MEKKKTTHDKALQHFPPPVVAVLGHVDHGKTTLLDAVRKTNVAQKEHGGITQKIAASDIEVMHEGLKRHITFIDTPGHEAFMKMRSRGAQAADIGLLVVSVVDGVMPQTRESIKLLSEAKIPFIVVLTKSDLPEKNIERIKQQVLKEGILLEGLGGDVPIIEVSAKTGKNIKELLELILLVFDINSSTKNTLEGKPRSKMGRFEAIVIESKIDPRIGVKATIVVRNGTISIKDEIISLEGIKGRVRALIDDKNQHVTSASFGEAVEILGFEEAPTVGSQIFKTSEKTEVMQTKQKEIRSTPEILPEGITFSIVLCVDTLGSLEAIVNALPKEVFIVSKKTGDITPSDVLLAKSTNSIILGFNVKIKPEVTQLVRTERVVIKNYTIIYELIDQVKDVIKGKNLSLEEEELGKAKILASFPFEKTKVMGVKVLEGRIAKGDRIKLVREQTIVGEGTITSLRQGKNVISKVEQGIEAGVIISPFLDFTIGDMIISHH